MDTTGNESARQPFNIEDPRANEILPLSRDSCFTMLISMLFVIATVGGFIYINMYLMFNLYAVTVGLSHGPDGLTPDNCQMYYCSGSAHYYVHNFAAYNLCNNGNCASVSSLCSGFNCSDINQLPVRWYNCLSTCPSYTPNGSNGFPPQLFVIIIVGCVAGGCFSIAVLISFFYGILAGCICGTRNISCGERLALFINFFCPSAKYFSFRQRNDWEDTRVNFKCMLWIDIIVTTLIAISLAGYIYLAIYQTFLFYEYLVTYGMGLMLLAYVGNLHRNYIELVEFQDRLDRLRR